MVIAQGHISFPSACEKMQTKGIPVSETHNLFYIWGLGEGDSDYISLKIFIIAFSKYGLQRSRSQKSPGSKWTWHLDLLSWHIRVGIPSGSLYTAVLFIVLSCFKTCKSCSNPIPQIWVSHVKITVVVLYSLLRNASLPQILNNKIWVVNKPKAQSSDMKVYLREKCSLFAFLSINAQGLWGL